MKEFIGVLKSRMGALYTTGSRDSGLHGTWMTFAEFEQLQSYFKKDEEAKVKFVLARELHDESVHCHEHCTKVRLVDP